MNVACTINPAPIVTICNISLMMIARTNNNERPAQTKRIKSTGGILSDRPDIIEIIVGIVAAWIRTIPIQEIVSAVATVNVVRQKLITDCKDNDVILKFMIYL